MSSDRDGRPAREGVGRSIGRCREGEGNECVLGASGGAAGSRELFTEDYRLGAAGGSASGFGRARIVFRCCSELPAAPPIAPSRSSSVKGSQLPAASLKAASCSS